MIDSYHQFLIFQHIIKSIRIQMSSLEIRVCGRYRLQDKLFQGRASTVYSGRNVQSDTDCAIKCESKGLKPSLVANEGKVLEEIQGGIGIPNLLWSGENGDFNFVITQLLGNSLEDYLQLCGGRFSLKTVLMIADKVLSSLQFLHYKNFVHRDVQPGNFLVGLGKKLQQIYTIDYAFATPFHDYAINRHRPDSINAESFVGTLRFASLNVLRGHRHSRRDDLESLGLMLISFLQGELPWDQPGSDQSPRQRRKQIRKVHEETPLEELCKGVPKELFSYLQYCRGLKYDEAPDYNYLKRIFKEKLIREGYQYDHVFDWILLPLRLKDTRLSNRIPLNRIPKKDSSDPALANGFEFGFREDFQFLEQWLRQRKAPKEEKKVIQDSRNNRSASMGGANNKPQVAGKGGKQKKDDCDIY